MPAHHRSFAKRSLGLAVAAAMLAAPVAHASPMLEPGSGDASPLPDPRPPSVTTTIDQGFDWGSAAIGAGSAGALLVLIGTAGYASHGRRHRTRPLLDGQDAGLVIRHRHG